MHARCARARGSRARRMCQLLYGGSVKAENAAALFAMADIDGGLSAGRR